MQTLSINIENDFVAEFMRYVKKCNDKIKINNDLNLEYDSYFYKRKEVLQQLSNDIKSGKIELQDWSEFELEMDIFEKALESKYAN